MLLNARGFAARTLLSLSACTALMAVFNVRADAVVSPLGDFTGEAVSADAKYLTEWVMASADNQGRPFAVVDKKAAKLMLFSAQGQLLGSSTVLLGLAPGDQSMPGVGQIAPSQIPRTARTTPAGRFASEPGHNNRGEAIVWFDYDAALAIHRLRPAAAQERRPQRMASDSPEDKRISLGCVVVPGAFYDAMIGPVLGVQRGVVYVMPETQSVQTMFNGMRGVKLAMLDTKH